MGCDIHVFIEKKIEGKWTLVNHRRLEIIRCLVI